MAHLKIFIVCAFVLLPVTMLFESCASGELKPDGVTADIPIQRVYGGDYTEVEQAIRAAMKKYPVKEDNLDSGIFETDFIRGDKMFRPPASRERIESGVRYHMSIHTIKGKVEGKPATRVIVKKVIEKTPDFFADVESLPSDGLEENIIFYRIQRELTLAKAIKRAAEAPTKASP